MPEGDAVRRTARRLHEALADREISLWELRWAELGASDRRGRTTIEVVPRGKHILQRLDDGWTLHSHLRMEGRWAVVPPGGLYHRNRADPFVRALVGSAAAVAIGRRLGMLDLVPTACEPDLVGHLGPDLLGPDWDADRVVANLLGRPGRSLGAALLDQTNLAGIGTMWCAEMCFLERVSPWMPVGEVDAGALGAIAARAHRLLAGSLAHRESVSTGNPRRPLFIHGRAGRPCPRCGTPISVAEVGEPQVRRTLHHCPRCQQGATPEDRAPRPGIR